MSLPIIDYPDFRYRRNNAPKKYDGIIVHWTAGTKRGDAAVKYTGREKSGGWYHQIMDLKGIHQAIDPAVGKAAHAGSNWNNTTIGVSIAQTVYPGFSAAKDPAKYQRELERHKNLLIKQGYDVELVPYEGNYPNVISLDQNLADAVAKHVGDLCEQFDIPKIFHTGLSKATVKPGKLRGVCCHHHVSATKWDCIPWMNELTFAFDQAGFTFLP